MQRRKFLASVGSLTAAGAAAMGTGAFTSVQAQRTVDVNVASDANAYLALNAVDERASTSSGELTIDFAGSNNGSSGLNPDARTAFTDLFEIQNQGENPVLVAVGATESDVYAPDVDGEGHLFDNSGLSGFTYAEEGGGGTGLGPHGGFGDIQIDSGGRVDLDINDGQLNSDGSVVAGSLADKRTLAPGGTITVDISVITGENPTLDSANNRISVLAAEPGSDRSNGGNGT